MNDKDLLLELLAAESEDAALDILNKHGLLEKESRWVPLGGMRNNESIVLAQQSNPTAALVEKITNGIDANLLRRCKAAGINPRSASAPQTMKAAVQTFFGDIGATKNDVRTVAEETMVLYATGSKARPCLSLYDAGEGQLPAAFPSTFCSLIFGSDEGSYKGAIPFVQGRFNMGGTGVLPFCGDKRQLQLIVSRVPHDVESAPHEWAFTVFCFFPSKQSPEWRYLTGSDGGVLTAGSAPLKLLPKKGAASGEVCAPREREVPSGTLIKMFDYKAPRSNICGELFKKLEEYLLHPSLPLRIIECRSAYSAKVMGVTVWDRFRAWKDKGKLEPGFEDGASIQLKLSTGSIIPAEVRVFKVGADADKDEDVPQAGLRALINGQAHARRDTQFFRTDKVDLEHIAGSMLVTLDCSSLDQQSRNDLFMSNRETFRDRVFLPELLKSVQKELHDHEGLQALNKKRYDEKLANATSDDDGLSALEDLLSSDPSLADLFGSMAPGKVAAKTLASTPGSNVSGPPEPFIGTEFPSYFKRASGLTAVHINIPRGGDVRVRFLTDVVNSYFTRSDHAGQCDTSGAIQPTFHLFNGRLTFTFTAGKTMAVGSEVTTTAVITDDVGHGPFKLTINLTVVEPKPKQAHQPPDNPPKVDSSPSRPDIQEILGLPDDPPIVISKIPGTQRLQLTINKGSQLLADAKALRPKEEETAVEFVFKYGLALICMGLIEAAKKTAAWTEEESVCRERIEDAAIGAGRVIVPLCLTLPRKFLKVA
jgi:hypothetical protein